MAHRRLFEILFIASAVLLVALVGVLNCLQGTPFMGGSRCDFSYTSGDFIIKAIAAVVFLVFLGLILGPVAITVIEPFRGSRKKHGRTEHER